MFGRRFQLARAAVLGAVFAATTSAQVITDPSAMSPGGALIDFESLPIGATSNPLVIGAASFSAGPGVGIASVAAWGANGTEVAEHTLLPFAAGSFPSGGYSTLTITFAQPVKEVGLGWFDPNLPNNRLRAFDSAGALIAEGGPVLGPPGGCCADFIGVVFSGAIVKRVEIVPDSGPDYFSIDNVRIVQGIALPQAYCTAKASSSGCLAAMTSSTPNAQPTSGAGDYMLVAQGVQGLRNGIVFYSLNGSASFPFQGGLMCVLPPLGRTPLQNSGGSSASSCDGQFAILANESGKPWNAISGSSVWFQAWFRDGALGDGFDTALSNAMPLDYY